MNKITVERILKKKGKSKITMLTCYDYSFAGALDEAGIDIILVGDSLANVVLGLTDTRRVSFSEMLNHTKAVASAATKSLVVADMPYASYQKQPQRCVEYAFRFMQGGANAVKVEWFSAKGGSASGRSDCIYVVKNLMRHKIPVMGHIGLTPQTAHLLGGFKVQGKDKDSAAKLIEQAKILEDLGAFSLVLECIPYQLARFITKEIKIPTIGIGAGKFCDGQVLVLYDFIGLYQGFRTKFVRLYGDFHAGLKEATARFIKDIRRGKFPNKNESFSMKNAEWRKLSAAFNTK